MPAPEFTNQLIGETSPYLLQHAHNPVNWYPWGEKALTLARERDLPILVSIGYSACHWCHVMERESFEDPGTAEIMNRLFINIKIDREERPDLDHIYMEAVQVISGSGGWPLNVFLTPDAKPFYGGTYFPPQPAYNRPSWKDVLLSLGRAWKERKAEIVQQADELTGHITRSHRLFTQKIPLVPDAVSEKDAGKTIAQALLDSADTREGGFGQPPKFPQFALIRFLLAYGHYKKQENALHHAHLSLLKIIRGGIFDQVGGGMARYSVDAFWLVPHFEKMLYDNALLLQILAEAFQENQDEEYKRTAYKTIEWLEREMKGKNGGFISALDADSEGEEGRVYLWEKEEMDDVLGEDAAWIEKFYGVSTEGNFDGKNILFRKNKAEAFALENGLSPASFFDTLNKANRSLLHRRNGRIAPSADDKIILCWNAMLVSAFIKCGFAFKDEALIRQGKALFEFLKIRFSLTGNQVAHGFKMGDIPIPGFIDDYAFMAEAGLLLYEATGEPSLLEYVSSLIVNVLDLFLDKETGLFFFTSASQRDLITRKIEIFDGPCPSGNSILSGLLFRLGAINGNKDWEQIGRRNLRQMQNLTEKYPNSLGNWCVETLALELGIPEIIVTGRGARENSREILTTFLPFRVHQWAEESPDIMLFQGRGEGENAAIYICHNQICYLPLKNATEADLLLKKLVC